MRRNEVAAVAAVAGSQLAMSFLSGEQYPWGGMRLSDFELHCRSVAKDVHPRDLAEILPEDQPLVEDGWVGLRVPSLTVDVGGGEICRVYFLRLRNTNVIIADIYSGLTYNETPYGAEIRYGYLPQMDGQQFLVWMSDMMDSEGAPCNPSYRADLLWDDRRWAQHDAHADDAG